MLETALICFLAFLGASLLSKQGDEDTK